MHTGPFEIPEMAYSTITALATSFRPLKRKGDALLEIATPVNLGGVSFLWDPEIIGEAPPLVEVGRTHTLHSFGYQGFFKPSIAEVMRQLPAGLDPTATHFEVIGPKCADDLNRESAALNAGYHVAETVFYRAV